MRPRTPLTIAACAFLLFACACGESGDSNAVAPTTTAAARTTTTLATTTTDTPGPSGNIAIWPATDSGAAFTDPVAAATSFATDFVGFTAPVVGEFQQGDSRSGEVEIRPTASGPATTVLVRQIGSDANWSVIGAATANIALTEPAVLDEISSPVHLAGTSTAFEGTVQTAVRDGSTAAPLGEGFVTGGSMGELGPFESDLAFTKPSTATGAVLMFTTSMENGNVWEATVVGVRFADSR